MDRIADALIGRVLDGRYRVGPKIARGGMATVYEATDLRLDRTVAVKVMHEGLVDDDEFVDAAMEELLRYVSPVLGFVRTVTEDHTYRGTELAAGDRVLMLYQSANRDERVFERPDELILDRTPNPHLAFGIGPLIGLFLPLFERRRTRRASRLRAARLAASTAR